MFKPVSVNSYTYISSSLTCPIQFEALLLLWKQCENMWNELENIPTVAHSSEGKGPAFWLTVPACGRFRWGPRATGRTGSSKQRCWRFQRFSPPLFLPFFLFSFGCSFSFALSHSQPFSAYLHVWLWPWKQNSEQLRSRRCFSPIASAVPIGSVPFWKATQLFGATWYSHLNGRILDPWPSKCLKTWHQTKHQNI